MTDSSTSVTTPASAGSSNHHASSAQQLSKGNAPKDRACPYCHVSFTSSSLGRHLDLYIKDKNPKPPDGVHDVDEIRKSRANITRRQARSNKRDASHDKSINSHQNGALAGSTSPTQSQPDRRTGGPMAFRNLFNTPHWTSTGVMTDSDVNQGFMNGDGPPPVGTPGSGSGSGMDPIVRRRWTEERERGRAAELALQELVDSIKAASSKSSVPPPYEFDFFSCSFPELCLRILTPPATLERSDFIPDNSSWPIDPPEESSYKAMQRKVRDHLLQWRQTYHPPNLKKRRRSDALEHSPITSDSLEPIPLYQHHLTFAWNGWASKPLMKKAPEWHIAGMRAFAREQQSHNETKSRLEHLETELSRARIDNARLTECQMPREWLHTPASQLPLAKLAADKVERELRNGQLDAEKLIAKWRPRVQAAKAMSKQDSKSAAVQLRMIGPGTTTEDMQKRSDMNYNGQVHLDDGEGEEEDEEEEGESEDYEEEDDEMEDQYDGEGEELEDPDGAIGPSLRIQMAGMATG